MIKVKIERSGNGTIRSFTVKGHAFYADPGKDIVCAGVSAVTVGTVNAIEELTGIELDSRMEDGFLQASVPKLPEGTTPDRVQLLLESMTVMLRSIEQTYGDFIAVRETRTKS
jgi:uncharacterized protein